MSAFQARLARVAGRAKRLKICEIEGQIGTRAHRLDMIAFQATTGTALNAFPAIPPLSLKPQRSPTRIAINPGTVSYEAHTNPRLLVSGRATMRAPSATEITVAAQASILPRLLPLVSL